MVKQAYFKDELDIPEGIKIEVDENHLITLEGPNGKITKDFSHIRGVSISVNSNKFIISTHFPKGGTLALAKTVLNIVNNLINGLETNYKYICKICYSHFPCSVRVDEKRQELLVENFLGERAPRRARLEDNVTVDLKDDDVILTSFDKEALGQTAANLKKACRIRKKDPRVFQDGVYLYKKQFGDEVVWEIK